MRITTKRSVAAVAAGLLAFSVAGIAYAFWTTSGAGGGSADTGDVLEITVNETSLTDELYPGDEQELSGDFTNSQNPGNVYITSVTVALGEFEFEADTTKPACTEADFVINDPTTSVMQQITPGTTANGSWSGPSIEMLNTALNQDNCKNVTVPLVLTAS